MKNGWELGADTEAVSAMLPKTETRHVWIQKAGLCSGGECINVPLGTMELLCRKKLIEEAPRTAHQPFWMSRFSLRVSDNRSQLSRIEQVVVNAKVINASVEKQ